MEGEKANPEEHITTVNGYNHSGQGVGRFRGKPVFIPTAARGETVRFALTREKKDFARGELLDVIEPAPWRRVPRCPVYPGCGGCHLQHLEYEEQLYFKRERVISAIRRIGGLEGVDVRPVLKMEYPWRYRHTARFHIRKTGAVYEAGFYCFQSRNLQQVRECLLLPEEFAPLQKALMEFLGRLKDGFRIPAREMVLRKGWATGELLVQLLADKLPDGIDEESVSAFAVEFPALKGMVLSVQNHPEAPGMVLFGRPYYTEVIPGTRFRIPAGAFFQNNPPQAEALLRTVTSFAAPQPHEILIDLYCGVGLFAHSLAPRVKRVFGVEENKAAVAAAGDNAAINDNRNTVFIRDRVEKALPLLLKKGIRPDVLILDPPRRGCSPQVIAEICSMSPGRVVYVSCDPATLARDLALFASKGYVTGTVQPVDMFPHTYHVECVVLMQNVNVKYK